VQDGVEGGANKKGRDAAEFEPGVVEDLTQAIVIY